MAAPPDPKVVGRAMGGAVASAAGGDARDPQDLVRRIRPTMRYWKRGSIATDYAAITCPVYVVDGWGDPYENIIGELLANLKVPRKGLIGPWGHIFPNLATPLGLDWPYEEVRWWQQWLEGVEHGNHGGAHAAGLHDVQGRFGGVSRGGARPLGGGGGLAVAPHRNRRTCTSMRAGGSRRMPKSREHVKYVGDKIVGLTKPQWVYGRPTEFEQSPDDRNSLVFDSAPLEHDLEILGYPIAKIRVSADVPVAQIAVRLTEVTPDGKILAGELQRAQSHAPRFDGTTRPP